MAVILIEGLLMAIYVCMYVFMYECMHVYMYAFNIWCVMFTKLRRVQEVRLANIAMPGIL